MASQLRKLRRASIVGSSPIRAERVIAPWEFSEEPTPEASCVNAPTPAGRALGEQIARLADGAEAELRKRFPDMHPRCVDCAAKRGTVPNGCEETLMDFLKCAIEGVQFNCHKGVPDGEKPTEACRGWLLLQTIDPKDPSVSIGKALGRTLPMATGSP